MAGQKRFSFRFSQIAQLKCCSSDSIISRRGSATDTRRNKSNCELASAPFLMQIGKANGRYNRFLFVWLRPKD